MFFSNMDLKAIEERFNWNTEQKSFIEGVKRLYPLIWNEHCTECGAPECYKTCAKFEENQYGKCKRISSVSFYDKRNTTDLPITYLRFREWAKVSSVFNESWSFRVPGFVLYNKKVISKKGLRALDRFSNVITKEKRYNNLFSHVLEHIRIKRIISKQDIRKLSEKSEIEFVFYSKTSDFSLILDFFSKQGIVSRNSYVVKKGINQWEIPLGKFVSSGTDLYKLELYPANNEEAELYFFLSDIVEKSEKREKVKCVVWDLDNTIWTGVVGDDGIENVYLRDDAVKLIKQLDERGIVQSIASKNEMRTAMEALKRFEIDQFFLYPQINWINKSRSLEIISKELNIGLNSMAFIDDSIIEREEIKSILPQIWVYSDTEIPSLIMRSEFNVTITEDSKKRRQYYQSEVQRKKALRMNENKDFEDFIKSSHYIVEVNRCYKEQDLQRCYELMQRTNQLNATTRRRTLEEIREINSSDRLFLRKIYCEDKFGEYGIVGCIVYALKEETLVLDDFVLSCRVVGKKMESALICSLFERYAMKSVLVKYVPSDRNQVLKNALLNCGGNYSEEMGGILFDEAGLKDSNWMEVRFD